MALPRSDPNDRRRMAHGLALALLVAIPFWAAVGLALVLAYQAGPITQSQGMLLAIATVAELGLLQYVVRASRSRPAGLGQFAGRGVAVVFQRRKNPLFRQTAMLGALAGAYLQYYFWDVYLQIESMNSVVVFLPVVRAG